MQSLPRPITDESRSPWSWLIWLTQGSRFWWALAALLILDVSLAFLLVVLWLTSGSLSTLPYLLP